MPLKQNPDGSFSDDSGNVFAPTPSVVDAYSQQGGGLGGGLFGAAPSFGAPAPDARLADASGAQGGGNGDPSNNRPTAAPLVSDTSNSPFLANAQPTAAPSGGEGYSVDPSQGGRSEAPPVAPSTPKPAEPPPREMITPERAIANIIDNQIADENTPKFSPGSPAQFEPTSRSVQRQEGPSAATVAEGDAANVDLMIAKDSKARFDSDQALKERGIRDSLATAAENRAKLSKEAEAQLKEQLDAKERAIAQARENLAKMQEDPDGYWKSRDSGQKAVHILASLFGGFGAALQASSGNGRAENQAMKVWEQNERNYTDAFRQNRAAAERAAAGLEGDYQRAMTAGANARAAMAAQAQAEQEAGIAKVQALEAETRAGIKTPSLEIETPATVEDEAYQREHAALVAKGVDPLAASAAAKEVAAQTAYQRELEANVNAGIDPAEAHRRAMTAAEAVRAGIEADLSRPATVERLDGAPVNVNANLLAAQERDRAAREKAAREAQFGGQVSESFKFVPEKKGGYSGRNLNKIKALIKERAALFPNGGPGAASALGGQVGYGDKPAQTVTDPKTGEVFLLRNNISPEEAGKLRDTFARAAASKELGEQLKKQISENLLDAKFSTNQRKTESMVQMKAGSTNVFIGGGAMSDSETNFWQKQFDSALNAGDARAAIDAVDGYQRSVAEKMRQQGIVGKIDKGGNYVFDPGTPEAKALQQMGQRAGAGLIDASLLKQGRPMGGPGILTAPKKADPSKPDTSYLAPFVKTDAPKPRTPAQVKADVATQNAEAKRAFDDAQKADRLRGIDSARELVQRITAGEDPLSFGEVGKRIDADVQPLLDSPQMRSLYEAAKSGNKGAAVALRDKLKDLERETWAKPASKGKR